MTTTLTVHVELHYELDEAASFAFAVVAARTARQVVTEESIVLDPPLPFDVQSYGEGETHQLVRVDAGADVRRLALAYDATVAVSIERDPAQPAASPFGDLPAHVLGYLNPSRYCESDLVTDLAEELFGAIEPGWGQVQAVSDWVGSTIAYQPGSTDSSSGTIDVLRQRAGVCRDFAHVAISLCRAVGIPARYVSAYGTEVDPPDFHGVFEAYLGARWWLIDPTGMSSPDRLATIGVGRDAADTSFATFVGRAWMVDKTVAVIAAT